MTPSTALLGGGGLGSMLGSGKEVGATLGMGGSSGASKPKTQLHREMVSESNVFKVGHE